ncbi:hypothetical protein [Actinoplanes teichomyceticus]|uniref:Uncharacterized protein n=1 Tax=Actinoplanes teichomyceticus TaxID=1867 RepID=A0A561WKU2_ACTTI|nr:hypothetical protein [Actinoplanes teichomyceticus]TWG24487.1 hypothetical protein FHX34_1021043 [Actinoplanes teichomyceticus]GIF12662.1 hypothetical protein Ate01nite_26940 [Actinoplanes teichomyceticus]
MTGISFHLNERGVVDYRADDRFTVLGLWLTGDVQASLQGCLDVLADLDDVAAGRKSQEEWRGNAFHVTISAESLALRNDYRAVLRADYPIAEVRPVIDDYWGFIAEGEDREAALAEWEQWNDRLHPRHGDLL